MTSSDRGYSILLSHLHNTASKLPLPTIQSALAHHLATASPLPTPLAATAISSPFYLSQPFTDAKLQSFTTAFRHACHLKYRALVDAAKLRSRLKTILGRSIETVMGQWVADALKGVQGGHPVLRLSACTGLLLGAEDLRMAKKGETKEGADIGSARLGVEDETVVALAEVMDTYASAFGSGSGNGVEEWEREFQPAGQDILSLALVLASQSLPLVAQHRLEALPLPGLARMLTLTIASTFKYGTFLSSVSASVTLSPEKQVHISATSPLAQTLQSMSSSPLTVSIASISRLTANVLALLIESPQSSHVAENLYTISDSLDIMREMAKVVERDWIACPLASLTDIEIASDSKETTKSIWTTLKTFLFSNIMLSEAVLSAAVYLPPQVGGITPATLALQTLHTLSHLSFVISEFGGVTTTTQGFEHLKKTFYLALDVLAQSDTEFGKVGKKAEAYVQQACFALNSQRVETAAVSPRQAKLAFVLASIEQLVPVLSDKCIRDWVWGICHPYLSDPTHRETYESAHSVILTVFASHAQRQQQLLSGRQITDDGSQASNEKQTSLFGTQKHLNDQQCPARVLSGVMNAGTTSKKGGPEADFAHNEDDVIAARFVERMVPFYAECLVDNSVDGKLNTPQLRLAYSALVRSASASAVVSHEPSDEMYTLAWYCIQLLLDIIHQLLPPTAVDPKGKGKARAQEDDANNIERVHRLHLMLISSISSLPLSLMLRTLDEVRTLITAYPTKAGGGADEAATQGRRTELLDALFSELLEKTGDREKEAAMRWWYQYRPTLMPESGEEEGKGVAQSWFKSRKGVVKESEPVGLQNKDVAGEENQNPSSPVVLSRL